MKQKRLVKDPETGRWIERYVDLGKGAALPDHGSSVAARAGRYSNRRGRVGYTTRVA